MGKEKQYREHKCEHLPSNGVEIYYYQYDYLRDTPVWRLFIRREATEEDLEENSILEQIGEMIWETNIEIYCCPYCGEKLPSDDEVKLTDYGRFSHSDSSSWRTK